MIVKNSCCPVVELRQYTLHPGRREALIELFEREFIESQEDVGIRVIAQFRDLDRPDVFTWLRGFTDMPQRCAALTAFYDGPVWGRHKDVANATMRRWDNIRLLRPISPASGFHLGDRSGPGRPAASQGLVVATIYPLTETAAGRFPSWFQQSYAPRLAAAGIRPIAAFHTEPSANTFPRLPVREGEHAFVWFAQYATVDAYASAVAALARDPQLIKGVGREWE